MQRSVLGKGLDVLIPKKVNLNSKGLLYLSIEQIIPSCFQPRQKMDLKELEELTFSIKEKGIIQPLLVRKVGSKFEVVAGHRRFRAAKSLGLKELPAIVRELSDRETFIFALTENLQRKDLNPIEESQAFKKLSNEFGLSYDEIARMIGKDKTSISNSVRLLKLPQEIQEALGKNFLTRTQARTILGLRTQEEQKALFYKILKEGLSVREIEEKVRSVSLRRKKFSPDPFVSKVEEKLKKALGTKVKINNKKNNSGKIIIEYYNLKDLERIINRIA